MSKYEVKGRRLTRYVVDAHVEIVNTLTDEPFGSLVDIHHEGLMLMADNGVGPNTIYQVTLNPRGDAEVIGGIELGIDCLWVRDMAQEGRIWAGCRIIDMSDRASEQIQQLIDMFGRKVAV